MSNIFKHATKKETKISFRTTELTFSRLKAISRIKNISVSALVEDILSDFLVRNDTLVVSREGSVVLKRKSSTPIIFFINRSGKNIYFYGIIIDSSEHNMKIVLVDNSNEILPGEIFSSLANLLDVNSPFILKCKVSSIKHIHEEYVLISTF